MPKTNKTYYGKEAKRIIKAKRQAGVIKKQKKEIIDSISAAIIAERWLNES